MRARTTFPAICACICCAALSWLPGAAAAAEMEFKPSLSISEEFNDNIFESASGRRHELITRVQPGASFRYQTPFWNWDATYSFDYRNYARNSHDDEFNHNAGLKGNLELVENFFYLDLSDSYSRVSLDVARNVASQSSLFLNQTDQNTAIVSPYLLWRPGAKNTLKTGYRYSDTRYWGTGIEKREHGAFADASHELNSKMSLTAAYAFGHVQTDITRYDKHDLSAGFRYEYAEKSFLFGQIGNSWQNFDNGRDVSYIFWNAGLTHDLGFAVATFETKVQTSEDPLAVSTKSTSYSGKLDKTLERGAIGFSSAYTEYEDTLGGTSNNRQVLSLAATGRYEVMQSLTASLSMTGERFYQDTLFGNLPYHFIASAGLSYAFNYDINLGLTYSYDSFRSDLDKIAGAKEINRVVVEVKKVF